jgi:hypothetical protein
MTGRGVGMDNGLAGYPELDILLSKILIVLFLSILITAPLRYLFWKLAAWYVRKFKERRTRITCIGNIRIVKNSKE